MKLTKLIATISVIIIIVVTIYTIYYSNLTRLSLEHKIPEIPTSRLEEFCHKIEILDIDKLRTYCKYSDVALLLIYYRHEPSNDFKNIMTRFGNRIFKAMTNRTINVTICTISYKESSTMLNISEINISIFPVIGFLIQDREYTYLIKPEVLSYIYSQLSVMGEKIPIELIEKPYTNVEDTPIVGDTHARFYLYIYEDAYCPFCAMFYLNTLPYLMKYIKNGTVAFILKNLIVHREVLEYHDYIQAMYLITGNSTYVLSVMYKIYEKLYELLSTGKGEEVRKVINLNFIKHLIANVSNITNFSKEILEKARKIIIEDSKEASKFGVGGTPGFILWDNKENYGIVFTGYRPWKELKKIIEFMYKNS